MAGADAHRKSTWQGADPHARERRALQRGTARTRLAPRLPLYQGRRSRATRLALGFAVHANLKHRPLLSSGRGTRPGTQACLARMAGPLWLATGSERRRRSRARSGRTASAAKPLRTWLLHRQSVGALTGRAALPFMASALAISCEERPVGSTSTLLPMP